MPHLLLTGFIRRDRDGIFVSHCNELDVDICANTLDEAQRMTPKMIISYFESSKVFGTYDDMVVQLQTKCVKSPSQISNSPGKWFLDPIDSQAKAHFNGFRE